MKTKEKFYKNYLRDHIVLLILGIVLFVYSSTLEKVLAIILIIFSIIRIVKYWTDKHKTK